MNEIMRGFVLCVLIIFGFSNVNADEKCPFGHMQCVSSEKCVPLSWKCDGDADCPDGSDEKGCPAKTCAETEFDCQINGTCIPSRWTCDGENDCDGGEDETTKLCANAKDSCQHDQFSCGDGNCISHNWVCDSVDDCENGKDEKNCSKTCGDGMFTCQDGQCISKGWHCDGDADCADKSDELECQEKQCEAGEFKCHDSTRCVDVKWQCDGDFDCADHSDETTNCTYTNPDESEVCSATEFKCVLEGECIHNSWKCDGDPDCTDGSDEGSHCEYSCKQNQFKCSNNVCIADILRCDHNNDCTDASDEEGCAFDQNCTTKGEFDCYGDGTKCIPTDRVCDGVNDCMHREDEEADLCKQTDPCINHACEEHSHCVKKTITYNQVEANCECNSGFRTVEGSCKDIDECKDPGMCSQICVNTKGGYKCECMEGYTLERHHFCRADGESAWLYYANRRDIRRLRSDTSFMEVVVEETGNSVGIDMDIQEGILFWTDVSEFAIKRADIGGSAVLATNEKVVLKHGIKDDFSSDGIAVDWLFKRIYWSEFSQDKIMVANYDGSKVKSLISGSLERPRAIVVDPENGYIYWTDWGKNAKIERCGMDGQGRETLLEGESLGWPNGLTIDYVSKRLFWIDAKLHKIGSMKLDGSDMKYIYEDATEIQQPFAIAVFEDSLYWTDWHTNSIKSVHKMTGLSPKTLNIGSYSIMDIKVYHGRRQNTAQATHTKNLCASQNCEFLCLPAARKNENATLSVNCVCGDNMSLNPDGKTCSPAPTAKTPKPTTKKPATTETPQVTTKKPSISSVTPDQPKVNSSTTEAAVPESQPIGSIAIITGVVVAVVFITVFVVGCLVVRKYKMKNKKSMNFDNPVYRKTTTSEDQCMITNEPEVYEDRHEEV